MFRLSLLSLLVGPGLSVAGSPDAPAEEPPACVPALKQTPAFDILTFTVVATVGPTIESWDQVLRHICPGPGVPGASSAADSATGAGVASQGDKGAPLPPPAGSDARKIVYVDHFEGEPSQEAGRQPAA